MQRRGGERDNVVGVLAPTNVLFFVLIILYEPDMHAKGSPKYNISQIAMGKKKSSPKHPKRPSPKITKRSSPKALKQRAQLNARLEKSLVEILHEHNNAYHRGQNGWSRETWNEMANMFHDRNKHVNFDKSQVQDKEKELKRDYRMLKDARSQSGVGWNESDMMLKAEPHLWENLAISFGKRIKRFQMKAFPLYDTLAELYHKHTAEGSYNFTATAEQPLNPDVTDVESSDDDEGEMNHKVDEDDDLQILDQAEVRQVQVNPSATMNAGPSTTRNAAPSTIKNKKPKKSPKKSGEDGLVGVMERFVKIKEKEAYHEATQDYSIAKCIAALRTLEGFEAANKPKAFTVFKSAPNREIFLSAINDNDGSAPNWLDAEMNNLQ
ncbi:unnamed protein product [Alopecurus aequalis]